jgi:AraC-like DNA-binding protein
MAFYTSPTASDCRLFTIDSIGFAHMRPPAARFRRDNGWRSHQFMYTMAGLGAGDIAGAEMHSRADTVWIMPMDTSHGYEPAAGCALWEYRWVEFSGEMAAGLLRMLHLDETPCVHGCREVRPVIEDVVALLDTDGNRAIHEASTLFMHALSLVERCLRTGRRPLGPLQGLDQAAKRYMIDNMNRPIQLEDIAAAVRVSPHHLIRVFRRHNGQTPMSYLRQLRASRAKSLLQRGDLNVSEVGRFVGYPVLQHFSRMFKQETGTSPREFRVGQLDSSRTQSNAGRRAARR